MSSLPSPIALAHIDHTGGLLDTVHAMRRKSDGGTVPVHAHPDLFKERFYESTGKREFIGVPHTRSALENAGARFHLAAGWQELVPGVWSSGEVPRRTAFELGDQELRHYDESGNLVVDPVRDDQTVVIDTADGMFVVLGCSYAGLINILTQVEMEAIAIRYRTLRLRSSVVWDRGAAPGECQGLRPPPLRCGLR